MTAYRYIRFLIITCALMLILAGCFGTSPNSRFYTLTPQENRSTPESTMLDTAVAIGPVTIPDYLDRRQIVTRSGQNEIVLAEFDLWGGSLADEITSVLVTNLSDRLNSMHISVFPWRFAPLANLRKVYRIPVNISRFDGTLGERVDLDAMWTVFVKGEKSEEAVLTKETTITEAISGKSYEALVAAMGMAVEKLGKEIADSVAVQRNRKHN
jgi:uncharacterized lipoprotein YmbA